MNLQRLMKLIDFMETLPRSANKHFYMGCWFRHKGDHDYRIRKYITKNALNHCGTTACALGWAAVVPSFHKAGLRIPAMAFGPEPMETAVKFFGIDSIKAHYLFNPGAYGRPPRPNTPKQWAKMARRLVKEWTQ